MTDTTTPSGSVTGTASGSQTGSASASSSHIVSILPAVEPSPSVPTGLSTEGIVFTSLAGTFVIGLVAYMLCSRRHFKTRKTTTASL